MSAMDEEQELEDGASVGRADSASLRGAPFTAILAVVAKTDTGRDSSLATTRG